ncbi:unnamed protein product [Ilex paraguariensis]|uniref:Uncharacterized protein n=1 Tax=Ilex paraguariensis TaxID=185542 RepID=A0ABC8T3J3_9AQUA
MEAKQLEMEAQQAQMKKQMSQMEAKFEAQQRWFEVFLIQMRAMDMPILEPTRKNTDPLQVPDAFSTHNINSRRSTMRSSATKESEIPAQVTLPLKPKVQDDAVGKVLLDFLRAKEECCCFIQWGSYNDLAGEIPLSIGALTSLKAFSLTSNKLNGSIPVEDEVEEVEFITKSRAESYRGNILYFMSGIDLSWNKLTGPIPPEIGYPSGIHTLNLSFNCLTGSIPEIFSLLKQEQSLDLSHNRLSGQIPSQVVELNFLSVFTVAYNNLSGRTPDRKAQFATFEEISYEGNPYSCGLPLQRSCTTSRVSPSAPPPSRSVHLLEAEFWWAFGESYVLALLGFIAFLYVSPYHRRLLFGFVEACVVSCR